MSVTYVGFRGKTVSREWATVLLEAEREVAFGLDSGHRTMAEQQVLYDHFLRFGSPLAAKPSATAPHIRAGRIDHALDVNALDGGAARLAAWLRRRGAAASSRSTASHGTSRCRSRTCAGSPTSCPIRCVATPPTSGASSAPTIASGEPIRIARGGVPCATR